MRPATSIRDASGTRDDMKGMGVAGDLTEHLAQPIPSCQSRVMHIGACVLHVHVYRCA